MSDRLSRAQIVRTVRSLSYAALSAGSGVFLLVLLVAAGRVLGDRDYGRFTFALALATILETLIDFGLKEHVMREVARTPASARRLVGEMLGLKVVTGVAALAILAGVVWWLRPEPDVRLAAVLLGLSSMLRSFWMTLRHTLNGFQRFELESAVVLADRVTLLVLGAAALWTGSGLLGLCAAFVAARGVAFAGAYLVTARLVPGLALCWSPRAWPELQRRAAPFGLFVATLNLYSYVDTLMLGVLRTDEEVGHYGAAYRLYEGLTNGAVIIATVAGPKLSQAFVADDRRHARLVRYSLGGSTVAAVPFAALGLVLAPFLLTWLFGSAFAAGTAALQLLSAGLLVVFPLQIAHAIAMSVNRERALVLAAGLGLVLNVAANSVLIPLRGIEGAAIATIFSETASLACLLWLVMRRPGRARTAVT
jgi:O-antigen/teichoic acid export membrane protein